MNFRFFVLFLIMLNFLTLPSFAEQRPRTFSLDQEKSLAKHPRVLSFLYHMTRQKLSLDEMTQRYSLTSGPEYYEFLIENKLIEDLGSEPLEFLFLNPHGTWALRGNGEEMPIIHALRKLGLRRLEERMEGKAVSSTDETSPLWITNTLRLTQQEFKQYKSDLMQVCKKYVDQSEHNLQEGVNHEVVWVMQLADPIDLETAKNDHLLFGRVDEF